MKRTYLLLVLWFLSAACEAQSTDPLPELRIFSDIYAKYALDEQPNIPADTDLIGIWKMDEDPDPHNYFVIERSGPSKYAFTYMSRGGSNRTYENVGAFASRIGGAEFINVSYRDMNDHSGYFFAKVTEAGHHGWNMTLSVVADPTLKDMADRQTLRDHIAKHINDPGYYEKPVHLHKILPLMYCK